MLDVISHSQWYPDTLAALNNPKDKNNHLSLLYSFWFSYNENRNEIKAKGADANMLNISENINKGLVFIDSGVFSARKVKYEIPVGKLIEFYHMYPDCVDWVFGMDEGTADEQLAKTLEMMDNQVPTVPIFHFKTLDYSFIDKVVEHGSNFIAISLFELNKFYGSFSKDAFKQMDNIFEYLHKNHWPIKVHLLGSEAFRYLSRYPFYSSDSSNIVNTFIMGMIADYNKKDLRIDRMHPKNEPFRVVKRYPDLELFIENYGKKVLGDVNGMPTRFRRTIQCIQERFEYQKLLTKIWKERGVIWND